MAKRPQLEAQKRTVTGRKVKALRRHGLIPANIFGKKTDSLAVQLDAKNFNQIFADAGETSLVDIAVEGEKSPRPVLIVNLHRHPVTGVVIHSDLHQVSLTEKVTANIPVEVTGESPAVKEKGAVLLTVLSDIEVEALPTDLPDAVKIDVSTLIEFNDAISVKDLKLDSSKVTVLTDADETVVMVQEPKEEVEEAPPAEEAEAEVEGAEVPEGETKESAEKADEKPVNKSSETKE